jgi:predicted amidohydrolase
VDYKGWKICPLICYDLRFPVWARNTENYDILLYVASWPILRINAWDALLKARAIENMSYTIGVNRTGTDAHNYEYSGHSAAYDCLGEKLCKSEHKEDVLRITLQKEKQENIRNKLGFLNDTDVFQLNP